MSGRPDDTKKSVQDTMFSSLESSLMRKFKKKCTIDALREETELLAFIQRGIEASAKIGLFEEEEIFKFLSLRFLFSPEQQHSLFIQGIAIRILDRLDWSGTKRLNFIYKHLVNRSPPFREEYYAPLLKKSKGGKK